MKTFEDENYYDVLQVTLDAGPNEIRQAYREALAIYAEESVATYSLFSEKQREVLQKTIQAAYETLNDPDKRIRYNQMLIDTHQIDATTFSNPAQRQLAARSDPESTATEDSLALWVSKQANKPEVRQLIDAMMSSDRLSGPNLKQLREAYGIDLSEVYAITRINRDVMQMIEADRFDDLPATVYLKQFLKSYAKILQIDPHHVVAHYLAAME